MQTITTLGPPHKRTTFTYSGSVQDGVTLHFNRPLPISNDFFRLLLNRFQGETIPGGFSISDPTLGGLGVWVQHNSPRFNTVKLTPRHASFIAAILEHEGHITSTLIGNKVMLHFLTEERLSMRR